MSAVDENIVREYFELHGFLVCQRRKYIVQARQKSADEEVDLIVLNPAVPPEAAPAEFEITSKALSQVSRAIVAVKGWHTGVFAPGVLANQPKIFRFVEKRAIEEAQRLVGSEGLVKILVVPGLPRDTKTRQRGIEVVGGKGGVVGVLLFANTSFLLCRVFVSQHRVVAVEGRRWRDLVSLNPAGVDRERGDE